MQPLMISPSYRSSTESACPWGQLHRVVMALCLGVLMVCASAGAPAWAWFGQQETVIERLQFDADDHVVTLHTQQGQSFPSQFSFFRYEAPYRLVVTIPKAKLAVLQPGLDINQNGIRRIELNQATVTRLKGSAKGTTKPGVQLVIIADHPAALDTIQIAPQGSELSILLGDPQPIKAAKQAILSQATNKVASALSIPLPTMKPLMDQVKSTLDKEDYEAEKKSTPAPASPASPVVRETVPSKPVTVIESVQLNRGVLTLTAAQDERLRVRQHFTLARPTRLVVDVDGAKLSEAIEQKEFLIGGPVQRLRVAQFDDETVRVVIETDQPDNIAVVHPNNRLFQLAFLGDRAYNMEPSALSGSTIGVIEDIQLEKIGPNTAIKIFSSTPMGHKVQRGANTIEVQLSQVYPKAGSVPFDKSVFPAIEAIELLKTDNPPSSLLRITLKPNAANPPLSLDSHLSFDGKYLELALQDPESLQAAQDPLNEDGEDPFESMGPIPNIKGQGFTVVVDSGHGGKDLGAHREGINEKDITLAVAHKLRKALEAKGVKVYMTRSTDVFLELSQITAITNRIHPDAFVSVHVNASVRPDVTGIETYYYHARSIPLAKTVHSRMIHRINYSPNRGVRQARFYVINHTPVPAILCEIGYISNSGERSQLITESRQLQTAEAISEGVVEFLHQRRRAELPSDFSILDPTQPILLSVAPH